MRNYFSTVFLLFSALAVSLSILHGCSGIHATPTGINVSNRCSLTERRLLASWENESEGFVASEADAMLYITDSVPTIYEGSHCLKAIYPKGKPAKERRSVSKRFGQPVDLSQKPMIEYGLLVAEGPGRDFSTILTLHSTEGETFHAVAHIIPTLWQGVIFDMHDCPFLSDVAAIDIGVTNDSSDPWYNAVFFVDGLSAGQPLDLDFEIPGSEERLVTIGETSVSLVDGGALIGFHPGSAVELTTEGSRNNIYSPSLAKRNSIVLNLENRSTADSLRLMIATDSCPEFSAERSKCLSLPTVNGRQLMVYNLSDLHLGDERLSALRLEPTGGEGFILLDRISFENEAPIEINAGVISGCVATDEAVTVKGRVDFEYLDDGSIVEILHRPLWKEEEPLNNLEVLGRCKADREFIISDIPNSRSDGRLTHLSSRMQAALRKSSGELIKIGEPFFIENWRDFIDNPYIFPTPAKEYAVTDFGAKGDGVTNDNRAIQSAIDKAAGEDGGKIVLKGAKDGEPPRQYLATNLELRKNTTLVIEPGAVLRQSPVLAHYKEFPPEYGHDNVIPGIPWTHCMYTNRPLILAKDTDHVKITGGGKIRMEDTFSENPAWSHYARTCSDRIHIVPIAVCNTRNVEISDIDILRCSNYHTIFYRADSVFIGNLKMHEVACLSGDGLSFGNAVTNVRAARCVYESNDDGIVLCSSYKDPRGGVWRERVDSIDSSVRHIEVLSCYIDGARGGGGKAIALIPWGSTNPRQDYNEIDDIEVRDCVLRGGHSVGSWPDNPFDGKPFDNMEKDDYAPVKNLRIFNNEYLSALELNGVVPTTLLTDCGLTGSRHIKNNEFNDRLAYWSVEGEVSSPQSGIAEINDGTLYQGLYLNSGKYRLDWDGEGLLTPNVRDMEGRHIPFESDRVFHISRPTTVLVGLTGNNAKVHRVGLHNLND